MRYLADLHVHSHYSRATARDANLESFHLWAQKKGVTLVGTGDCTHPGWFKELSEKLVSAEPGLFALSPEIAEKVDRGVPASCRAPVRFVLSGEISCIYKKDGRTRKNHNVVLFPDFGSVEVFNRALAAIGNIRSDGRPILGLDARDLLETALSASADALFIPAHIWTPWFSVLGSKSGFDSIRECFGDLAPHIRAVETGLSSDPPMNWRVPDLDGLTLVSHSDAHSPAKLMREANILDADLSYEGLRNALDRGPAGGFAGTIEFFPEEGKYHLDGHRKCGVVLDPEETRRLKGRCPKCGKPLTVGVLYRVHELAKRPPGGRPPGTAPFFSLIPLADLLAEAMGRGPATKGVVAAYEEALAKFGPERAVILDLPVETLRDFRVPLLAEAVDRMRRGEVCLAGGYDGEYGTVRIFSGAERQRLQGQAALFRTEPDPPPDPIRTKAAPSLCQPGLWDEPGAGDEVQEPDPPADSGGPLNPDQERAVSETNRPVLVVAGPGTGKTRTLVHRAARLLREGVDPASILAVTFTTRAAAQLKTRLAELAPDHADRVFAGTFHALSLSLLAERAGEKGVPGVAGEEDREFFLAEALARTGQTGWKPGALSRDISRAKQALAGPDDPLPLGVAEGKDPDAFQALYRAFQDALARRNLMDYDDILVQGVRLLERDSAFAAGRFSHVLVDEYQDINPAQYRLLKALCPNGAGLFAIGDPDQAIYGFRGSDLAFFQRFTQDFPNALVVDLSVNYRSMGNVLAAADRVIRPDSDTPRLTPVHEAGPRLFVLSTASPAAEAEAVVCAIEETLGGTSLFAVDSGRAGHEDGREWGFADFAVLFRTREQAGPVAEALARSGIPFQFPDRKAALAGNDGARLVSLLRLARGLAADPDVTRALSFLPGPLEKTVMSRLLALAGGEPLAPALGMLERWRTAGLPRAESQALGKLLETLADTAGEHRVQSVEQTLRNLAARFLPPPPPEPPGSEPPLEILFRLARDFGNNTVGFLAFHATAGDADLLDPRADRVTLSTVHAAKGLEFPGVFVLGCEDGLFPLRLPGRTPDLDEERRLFYVAVTRAARRLWLLSAKRRTVRGKPVEYPPSPFLAAVSESLLDRRATTRPRPPSRPVQTCLGFE